MTSYSFVNIRIFYQDENPYNRMMVMHFCKILVGKNTHMQDWVSWRCGARSCVREAWLYQMNEKSFEASENMRSHFPSNGIADMEECRSV